MVDISRLGMSDNYWNGFISGKRSGHFLQHEFAIVRYAGQLDMHGPRPPAASDVESLGHDLRNVCEALNARSPFSDGLEHLIDESRVVYAVKGLQVRIERHSATDVH